MHNSKRVFISLLWLCVSCSNVYALSNEYQRSNWINEIFGYVIGVPVFLDRQRGFRISSMYEYGLYGDWGDKLGISFDSYYGTLPKEFRQLGFKQLEIIKLVKLLNLKH